MKKFIAGILVLTCMFGMCSCLYSKDEPAGKVTFDNVVEDLDKEVEKLNLNDNPMVDDYTTTAGQNTEYLVTVYISDDTVTTLDLAGSNTDVRKTWTKFTSQFSELTRLGRDYIEKAGYDANCRLLIKNKNSDYEKLMEYEDGTELLNII